MKWRPRLLAVSLLLTSARLAADIDESAYLPGEPIRDSRELARLKQRVDAEARAQIEQDVRSQEAARRAREEAAAREAARPYAERLTAQRCTLCHAAVNFENKRHTWLGWRLVVSRMRWLNRAPIAAEEQSIIVGHLAQAHPADARARLIEYGLPLAAVATAIAGVWRSRNRRRSRRERAGAEERLAATAPVTRPGGRIKPQSSGHQIEGVQECQLPTEAK